jgi:hypothetical protein
MGDPLHCCLGLEALKRGFECDKYRWLLDYQLEHRALQHFFPALPRLLHAL